MKKGVIIFFIVSMVFIISSCSFLIKTPVPPGSYTLKSAVLILDGRFILKEFGNTNAFADIVLGEGEYAFFQNFDGMMYVFKYDDIVQTKKYWKKFSSKVGNILKINYYTINLFDRGYLRTRFQKTNLVAWWKDKWLFIVSGENPNELVNYIESVYRMVNE
ncbi:DUF3242 domain-containing protein [Thermosipho ferrireducens]|uniref:DUF3242 domain-containing protein n=1 Tax=Thermosipho ferrireducens TaxID=2571116 RepID=A0ABX7S5W6_9BACT|nr:DUF3242 domain-containing protein [Thermosipho ferrireducens]QTA37962.1 DUF3242 domain-containing protein [Thermosipho ferrireducens]